MNRRVWFCACGGLVGVVALLTLYFIPFYWLTSITSARSTRVRGWQDSAVCVIPRKPYDVNVDRVISLLPFVPSVIEVRVPRMEELGPRLDRLAAISTIISLDLSYAGASDDELRGLSRMTQLECLLLTGNEDVTDHGVAIFANFARLRILGLAGTAVTGMSLSQLAPCRNLETLELMNCPVTDEAIATLPRFPKIHTVNLSDTQMTEQGLMHFVNFHYLRTLAIPNDIPREARLEFNRRWRAEYDRAREAGEEVPPRPWAGLLEWPGMD